MLSSNILAVKQYRRRGWQRHVAAHRLRLSSRLLECRRIERQEREVGLGEVEENLGVRLLAGRRVTGRCLRRAGTVQLLQKKIAPHVAM